ncbi:MAG: hypothetical protein ACYDA8_23335 [Deferrisomatales bacterium]
MSFGWLSPEEAAGVARGLEERFGIPPEALARFQWFRRGEALCAVDAGAREVAEGLQAVAVGLKVLKEAGSAGPPKLTSRGAQLVGGWATRRVCEVGEEDLRSLLEGRSLPWDGERGPAIVRFRGAPVGMGLVRDGQLVGQFPRSITEHLRLSGRGAAL